MSKSNLGEIFASLEQGDVLFPPSAEDKIVVLKTREGGGVFFGTICECGEHVQGFPNFLYWNEKNCVAATKDGKVSLPFPKNIIVEKGAAKELAEQFSSLATADDFDDAMEKLNADPEFSEKTNPALSVLGLSGVKGTGHAEVAALRALGAQINDEQAAAYIAARKMLDYTTRHTFGGTMPLSDFLNMVMGQPAFMAGRRH